MTSFDRITIARLFCRNTKITRAEIFGPADPKPLHLPEDAETMFAGYVGSGYCPGNPLLLAINPGGGGDTYEARSAEDIRFYPLLQRLRDADEESALGPFEAINQTFSEIVRRWNLIRIVAPVLMSTGATLDSVAYVNAVPYRTRGDKAPLVAAKARAWTLVTGPTIRALQPGIIVALGKKAGDILGRFHDGIIPAFTVPRTIGDTYVSTDAEAVLALIRASRQRI